MDVITICPDQTDAALVPDGLFGFNMEITRQTMFSGLSAEMLNNRKFFAVGETGLPAAWQGEGICFVTNRREESLCSSNFVVIPSGGSLWTQGPMLAFQQGKTYRLRLWVSCHGSALVTISIGNFLRRIKLFPTEGGYEEYSEMFLADITCERNLLRLSIEGDAVTIYELSLMPTDNFHGMRPDVIEMIKALRPTKLRFPGGCCADHFNWKESLKDPAFREPIDGSVKSFLFRDTYHQDCYDIGLHEFIWLCLAVEAEPEYTVRLVLSDEEEARALVEYCNGGANTRWGAVREQHGFSPFGIKTWYVGNEIYYFGYGLEQDAALAAARTDAYARNMRLADPSISLVVGVCGDFHHDEWDMAYIRALTMDYEFVSFHRYNGTEIDSDSQDQLTLSSVEDSVLGGIDERLEFLKQHALQQKWDRIRINVDEWNFTWGLRGSSVMLLSNALFFHFMMKSSPRYPITEARFFHPINEGMIDVHPLYVNLDTSGLLFALLNKHRGGRLLKLSSDSPDWDVAATLHDEKIVCSVVNRRAKLLEIKLVWPEADACCIDETRLLMERCSGLDNRVYREERQIKTLDGTLVLSLEPHEIIFLEWKRLV